MSYTQELRALVGPRPLIMPGAAVLIFNHHNHLLLQHRTDNQKWGLIGGSMEIDESLEETARREVFEETGLELDELEWFDLFSGPELVYQYPNGDVVVNVVAVYIARRFSGTLKMNAQEVDEVRFFQLGNLPKNLSPPDRPVLEQFLHSQNS